jgi:hypothetical protein
MATEAAPDIQERLHHEMDDCISFHDKILQSIQSQHTSTENDISSPVKKVLDTYQELDEYSRQALWNTAITMCTFL